MDIRDYFVKGDMRGAMEYMRTHEGFGDILPLYVSLFEDREYRAYGLPEPLEGILLRYQEYFRDVFYCGIPETEAARKLGGSLAELLDMPEPDEDRLTERMGELFAEHGYHSLFGNTQGYYGPYIWKETVPAVYNVRLPDGTREYTVNILKGFVFRSWMDYLTFGQFGTGGWASKDGTLNCVEQAYDLESDAFRISFLKHEAQHAADMERYPGITVAEMEYRAKLAELMYFPDAGLLQRYLQDADESRENDGHASASVLLKKDFADADRSSVTEIQNRAALLYRSNTDRMREKYGAYRDEDETEGKSRTAENTDSRAVSVPEGQ